MEARRLQRQQLEDEALAAAASIHDRTEQQQRREKAARVKQEKASRQAVR